MQETGRRNFIRNSIFAATGMALAGLPVKRLLANDIQSAGPTKGMMDRAMAAFARHNAMISNRRVMAVADFSVASAARRFHIINMENGQTHSVLVAHGRGSDPDHSGWVQNFSNVHGSEATSSGAYLASESYTGQHGFSRRLIGLDPENDQAEARAIVIHSAAYVDETVALERGKIGRSQGCFAFSVSDIGHVMWQLPPGTLLYADKI
jgi:hypothetical protein